MFSLPLRRYQSARDVRNDLQDLAREIEARVAAGETLRVDTGCLVASPYDYAVDSARGPISQWSFLGYRSVHEVMREHGDGGKPIWLTEFGWSS